MGMAVDCAPFTGFAACIAESLVLDRHHIVTRMLWPYQNLKR